MKRAIICTLVLLSLAVCGFSNSSPIIKVVFNRTMTFDDLVKIKNDLHQKHIDLSYKMMAFDENHHLEKIDFEVNCNDGFKGSASSDHLTNTSSFGFYRNYAKGSASPFGTGDTAGK